MDQRKGTITIEKIKMENLNNIKETVLKIIQNIGSIDEKSLSKVTVDKFDKILSLQSCNIKLSNSLNNFDTNDYRIDKSTVFNYKMKYTSTGDITNEDVTDLIKIYQKHKNIAKLLLKS